MLKALETRDVAGLMADIGRKGRAASRRLATAAPETKTEALRAMAKAIRQAAPALALRHP
jgi:glutamate-5-semialdehyde dehydrogenase